MKLEDQVASLEVCKRLEELGYPQEGLFWWRTDHKMLSDAIICTPRHKPTIEDTWLAEYIVAPTVAEMGEWLPDVINFTEYLTIQVQTTAMSGRNGWRVFYKDNKDVPTIVADTEVDARAKMLIYLLENKLISLEK